jgi:hypothetical protein
VGNNVVSINVTATIQNAHNASDGVHHRQLEADIGWHRGDGDQVASLCLACEQENFIFTSLNNALRKLPSQTLLS